MRVAFDEQIFVLQAYGGISRMFAELARQFYGDPELGIELLPLAAPIINRYVLDDEVVRRKMAVWDAGHEYKSLLRYMIRVQPRRGNDIVHNTFYLPHGLASYPGAKRIVTVHDMIPELMPHTRRRLDFLTLKKRYVMHADHVICVSEATRDDLVRVYGPIKAPITVVHHGVDPVFRPDAEPLADLPDKYILFVGHRSQYKDAPTLMRAFAAVAREDAELRLLFVGGGPFNDEEQRELSRLGISDLVLHRSLPDAQMPAAYGNAIISVFPSTFEGFGLPALESMACGTPTVLARATSLPEVGGDAAEYFEPRSVEDLTRVMAGLLGDRQRRNALHEAGLQRAAQFTWRRSAEETLAVYRSALAS